mmetsp:Transcript_20912/g.37051  ORF Transcript_20912/g.37051 Transcript_20912/m.37051 type:complete len:835 (-) Transcript_20912:38-2542(-)
MGHTPSRERRSLPAGVTAKFSSVELDMLTKSFDNLAQRSKGKTIDKETFLSFFPLPGLHGERLFEVFDHKQTGVIDYEEFITGLAVCVRGTFEEKVRLIFNIYDIDKTHFVSKDELRTMLIQIPRKALYLLSGTMQDRELRDQLVQDVESMNISSTSSPCSFRQAAISDVAIKVVDRLVEEAFQAFDLNKDDRLSLSQFREWVKKTPEVLDFVESVFPLHDAPGAVALEQSEKQTATRPSSPSVNTIPESTGSEASNNHESTSSLRRLSSEPQRMASSLLRKWSGSSIGSDAEGPPSPKARSIRSIGGDSFSLADTPMHPTLYGSDTSAAGKSGVLYKSGRRTRKMMGRFFLLQGQMLYYYYPNKLSQPAGIIFLQGCYVTSRGAEKSQRGIDGPKNLRSNFSEATITTKQNKAVADTEVASAPLMLHASHLFPFEIITSQGGERDSRILYAKTEEERQSWVMAIKKASNVVPFKDKYHLLEKIGQGKFATVFKCELLDANVDKAPGQEEYLAVKVIDKGVLDETERELLRTEIAVLKLVNHPNIINMEDVFESLNHIYIVLERVAGGELFDRIVGRPRLQEVQAFAVIKQLAEAVNYLHILGVAHRDIKPENILCSGRKEDPVWESRIKLCDFGLSKLISPQGLMTLACGTLSYVAPEVLSSSTGYGKAADVWNIGVIHYLVRRGRLPFDGDTKEDVIYRTIHTQLDFHKDPVFSKSSAEEKSFLQGLLSKNPRTRLTTTGLLRHPWMVKMEAQWRAEHGDAKTFLDDSNYGFIGTPAVDAGAPAAFSAAQVSPSAAFEDLASPMSPSVQCKASPPPPPVTPLTAMAVSAPPS